MFIKLNQPADHAFDEPLGLLSDCHRRIERFLRVLLVIARENQGGVLPADRQLMLRQALEYFRTAAPRHTADEEASLFPRLESAAHPEAEQARAIIERLGSDHRKAEAHHAAVDAAGEQWLREGRLDGQSVADLVANLEALDAMYREHIAVEDQQLFPAAGRILQAGELESIGREMADRRGVKFAIERP